MNVTEATYRDGRRYCLLSSLRYLRYAKAEPTKSAHFRAHRKVQQRHLAQLRSATRRPTNLH